MDPTWKIAFWPCCFTLWQRNVRCVCLSFPFFFKVRSCVWCYSFKWVFYLLAQRSLRSRFNIKTSSYQNSDSYYKDCVITGRKPRKMVFILIDIDHCITSLWLAAAFCWQAISLWLATVKTGMWPFHRHGRLPALTTETERSIRKTTRHFLSISWKISKFHGLHKNWPSMAILNNDLLHCRSDRRRGGRVERRQHPAAPMHGDRG